MIKRMRGMAGNFPAILMLPPIMAILLVGRAAMRGELKAPNWKGGAHVEEPVVEGNEGNVNQ